MDYLNEEHLVEKPIIEYLESMGYAHIFGESTLDLREFDEYGVILKPVFIDAVKRFNNITTEDAERLYMDFIRETDNEKCIDKLRGNFSFLFTGEKQKRTVNYIDYDPKNIENNTFNVVSQMTIKGANTRRPDLIVFVNGIPLVVIECKSPIANQDIFSGITQIHEYERDLPKLFYSNAFNVATDGKKVLYGATDAPSKYYLEFKDPYPKKKNEFKNALEMGCYCVLEPERLLDLLHNFILFEVRDRVRTKKICRYQQYRAVNKIVNRVIEGSKRKGLIWHTQGSGKSLTMFYTAYKLKLSKELNNPNILLITDRIDLDDQISKTFVACGFRNPIQIESIKHLKNEMENVTNGQTLMSTIHKFREFEADDKIKNSDNFIVFVDECHRTQEGNMGSKLRAVLPDAFYFGFTGTPIKKKDKNTYENFGMPNEGYLDKYGIDDAIADNVTVPIYYSNKTTVWNLTGEKLDILFEESFRELTDEQREELKKRESKIKNIIKNKSRIELIAYDIWAHYKNNVAPNGFKAQVVAIDREAIILYKKELDKYFGEDEVRCVYSKSQHDDGDFVTFYADEEVEKEIKDDFKDKDGKTKIIIVCDKLLTGFDAPIEQVMYLDSPLKEHNLLQAIARTNRVYSNKENGLIMDYYGVSDHLTAALSSYRSEDVVNAMRDLDELRDKLKGFHREVMEMFKGIKRNTGKPLEEITQAVEKLNSLDIWYMFKGRLKRFSSIYNSLSPDPSILQYKDDLKWLAVVYSQGKLKYEPLDESIDYREYGAKVKEIIDEHLKATGLKKLVELKDLSDPDFFKLDGTITPEQNALKKSASLKRILMIKVERNPIVFKRFSEYLEQLIKDYDEKRIETAEVIKKLDELARQINEEEELLEKNGLNRNANSFLHLLEENANYEVVGNDDLKEKAMEIDELFENSPNACYEWQKKEDAIRELKKEIKRKTIGVVKDREGFANKVVEYAKVNYYKG